MSGCSGIGYRLDLYHFRVGLTILRSGRKRVLVVLFVPSVERDGVTPVDQAHWVDAALAMFGRVQVFTDSSLTTCRLTGCMYKVTLWQVQQKR